MESLQNPGFALFAFGGLLLLIGLVGGGMEISVLKIPRIDGRPRFFASVVGAVCSTLGTIILLLGLSEGTQASSATPMPPSATAQAAVAPGATPAAPATTAPSPTAPPARVTFTIHDQLGSSQEGEQLVVFIDGQYAGELLVDTDYPTDVLTIGVDRAGAHTYRITGRAIINTTAGTYQFDLYGEGTIDVQPGKGFTVFLANDRLTNPLPIVLKG